MEIVWFNDNNYKSLGDVYKRFCYLNLKDESVINLIDQECAEFLYTKLSNYNRDIQYFEYDFTINELGDIIVFKPDNIVCALWFIGIFPLDTQRVFNDKRFENTKYIYTFDKKTCKLKCKERTFKK